MQQPPATPSAPSKWIVVPRPNPAAEVRLFCFPSAGHGPSMFRTWAPLLGPTIELALVQLPGREGRWREPAYNDMSLLAPALVGAFESELDRPWALFGHSLGALIAFEVARRLRAARGLVPRVLFASAHRAPQLPNRHPEISLRPDQQFEAEVNARHGGIPAEVASNKELMDLMRPSLRADYRLFESYRYATDAPLPCPIVALGGTLDEWVTAPELEGWRAQTSSGFKLRQFEGGHFFVNDKRPLVLAAVAEDLAAARPAAARTGY